MTVQQFLEAPQGMFFRSKTSSSVEKNLASLVWLRVSSMIILASLIAGCAGHQHSEQIAWRSPSPEVSTGDTSTHSHEQNYQRVRQSSIANNLLTNKELELCIEQANIPRVDQCDFFTPHFKRIDNGMIIVFDGIDFRIKFLKWKWLTRYFEVFAANAGMKNKKNDDL